MGGEDVYRHRGSGQAPSTGIGGCANESKESENPLD